MVHIKESMLSKNTNEIEAKGYLTGHQDVSSLDDATNGLYASGTADYGNY